MFYYPSLPIACNNNLPFLVFYLPNEYNNSSSFLNCAFQSSQNHSVMHVLMSQPKQAANSSSNQNDQSEAKFLRIDEQPNKESQPTHISPSEAQGEKKMRLNFRVKWCNQYRNIVPNLINQLMSFLLKRTKSQKVVRKFFNKLALPSKCTISRFYLYMRGMRDSFSHYLNEGVLSRFFELHEPNLHVYSYQEQTGYMKVCRMCIQYFLSNDCLLLTLVCQKMQPKKKQLHLIGRRALLEKFIELARQNQ